MSTNKKYPRTFHLTFSPGATNDDKIISSNKSIIGVPIIISEKLDGSNFCITSSNCYARSHSGPPTHKSFDLAKAFPASVKDKCYENIIIYMEYMFAKHSIFYDKLQSYFNIINIFDIKLNEWLSWNEVELWAQKIYIPTVPVLFKGIINSEKELQQLIESLMIQSSCCGGIREGVVARIQNSFTDQNFSSCVLKCVRANHVQTSEHWKNQEIIKNKFAIIS